MKNVFGFLQTFTSKKNNMRHDNNDAFGFFGHLPNHHIQPLTAINNVNIGIGKLFIYFVKIFRIF